MKEYLIIVTLLAVLALSGCINEERSVNYVAGLENPEIVKISTWPGADNTGDDLDIDLNLPPHNKSYQILVNDHVVRCTTTMGDEKFLRVEGQIGPSEDIAFGFYRISNRWFTTMPRFVNNITLVDEMGKEIQRINFNESVNLSLGHYPAGYTVWQKPGDQTIVLYGH